MMNYEVNSFQNYESITIDELKDQANSLLNLVTEEQRPLRVCMNNGKEFLLFPQDLLAPICDSDFRLILLSAMRYAMGRNTCMPVVISNGFPQAGQGLIFLALRVARSLCSVSSAPKRPCQRFGFISCSA